MKKINLFVSLLLLTLSACVNNPSVEPKKEVSKIFKFDEFVENNLGPVTQVTRPPNCGTWLSFIRGVVKKESNWKAEAEYVEKFVDHSTGKRSVSTGYFQLSLGDKSHYQSKYCQQLSPVTIKDPMVNTGCALEIMEKLLQQAGDRGQTPRQALGRYWSVVRDSKEVCGG